SRSGPPAGDAHRGRLDRVRSALRLCARVPGACGVGLAGRRRTPPPAPDRCRDRTRARLRRLRGQRRRWQRAGGHLRVRLHRATEPAGARAAPGAAHGARRGGRPVGGPSHRLRGRCVSDRARDRDPLVAGGHRAVVASLLRAATLGPTASSRRRRHMPETDPGSGRPDAAECLPYYFNYIDLVPDGDVLSRLERQMVETAAYLDGFTPEQAGRREAPGEWNAVEIVGHLADTERVFGYRALNIARAHPIMWSSVEFPEYAAAAGSGACAPSPGAWPATSCITWRTSAASTPPPSAPPTPDKRPPQGDDHARTSSGPARRHRAGELRPALALPAHHRRRGGQHPPPHRHPDRAAGLRRAGALASVPRGP